MRCVQGHMRGAKLCKRNKTYSTENTRQQSIIISNDEK